jgi:hypothetical protein
MNLPTMMLSATRKSSFAKSTLAALVRDRAVRCDDEGPDPVYPTRRIGACWVEGDDLNLNQRLVREGWALNFEPYAKHRFKADRTTRKTTNVALERLLLNTTRPAALEQEQDQTIGFTLPKRRSQSSFPG